jgi:thiamine biosynthesis lipoprotein
MAAIESIRGVQMPGVRVQRLRPALGTWVAIEATAATQQRALAAVQAAYLAVLDVGRRLHPCREGSELERLRSAPPYTRVPIEATTWELLRLAQRMHALSEGIFDPCLPSCPGRLCDLSLSASNGGSPWALCRAPLALDLGGIAKGYAIDRAIEALRAAGCGSGLVNAGGDLRVCGRSETVLLRYGDGTCAPVTLTDEALAVSDLDADVARRPAEHRGYYRRSGSARPARPYAAVVAASAAVADALTKCVLLADERCAARALHAVGARQIG